MTDDATDVKKPVVTTTETFDKTNITQESFRAFAKFCGAKEIGKNAIEKLCLTDDPELSYAFCEAACTLMKGANKVTLAAKFPPAAIDVYNKIANEWQAVFDQRGAMSEEEFKKWKKREGTKACLREKAKEQGVPRIAADALDLIVTEEADTWHRKVLWSIAIMLTKQQIIKKTSTLSKLHVEMAQVLNNVLYDFIEFVDADNNGASDE